ncbi:hypothetical protein [Brevibacillus choshinensis]|uniref:Copper amine oxidase-like N-terminal domain-containing protein n=1 Tax=Brevibacillus choshinensis TaxID=54911 RepID=A0ABX7FKJ5_BRECH|nr:hypothetical protein [Brevibacillus choshinensis]QRG65841.1 hypothetical protein JNE38_19890 [Brevibacillus choshinensis]
MKKMGLMLVGILGSLLILGGTPSFADSAFENKKNSVSTEETKQLEPQYAIDKPMGNGNVKLVVDINFPFGKGYYLEDNGKYLQIPNSGDTIISEITPFLYLTAFGYPHDFLVIERDKKVKSIMYISVYNYFQGQLTKVTSFKTEQAKDPDIDVHVAHEKGFNVYINEHKNHEFISSTAYEFDSEAKSYKKVGILSK